ncbi:Uncharacterised protein [uncultured Clostridium sp.]|nr:Uncharacterised protein [uncultured Clostridium sp.]SCI85122.1 Uncharacterised protein [uncultured Clostridium sp.]
MYYNNGCNCGCNGCNCGCNGGFNNNSFLILLFLFSSGFGNGCNCGCNRCNYLGYNDNSYDYDECRYPYYDRNHFNY